MLRVLMILGGPMYYGGTELFLMNYYRHINRNEIQFDFVCPGDEHGVFDDEITKMGGRIFHVPHKLKHPVKYTLGLKKIILDNGYKIIHSQMNAMGCWPLAIAKSVGVPMRIAHSHSTKHQTSNSVKFILNDIAKLLLRKYATDYYACGYDAGVFLFGKKLMVQNKVQIIHNAIELDKYAYSDSKRNKIRKEFGIKDEIVIGHVGQFHEWKNHKKIIEIFTEIAKADSNVKLMLVGDGPLKSDIQTMAKKNNIRDKVIFTGSRDDVSDILNAFDVFLFPSLFEGLGIVAIESQANGLPTVVSDAVPDEALITDIVIKEALESDACIWKDTLYKALKAGRKNENEKLIEAGYDIVTEAIKLEERYVKSQKN